MTEFPLTRAQFQAWLETHADDEVVGLAWRPLQCPLSEACGSPEIAIQVHEWSLGPRFKPRYPMPGWAVEFVAQIDRTRAVNGGVTAAEARAVLSSIPEEG